MLDEAEELPEGKKVDFYFAEADGVFVHKTERKKSIEVHHAIMYEGWEVNGKRVSLENPMYVLTTKSISKFWDEVQAKAASQYSLEEAHVITNSDGGKGYGSERFQEAFSQSNHPVLTQLDSYHINQALNRALGVKSNEFKRGIQEAIKEHNREAFNQWLDTYESTLEDSKQIKKVQEFRKYILGNWERIFDWRDNFENLPENSRGLGAMESNQRHISYRMKKRGMHWSPEGAEAMVKVKQGILNHTLRDAYLSQQTRSTRKQRESRKIVRISSLLHQKTRPSIGAKQGSVPLYTANSSAMGVLKRNLQ